MRPLLLLVTSGSWVRQAVHGARGKAAVEETARAGLLTGALGRRRKQDALMTSSGSSIGNDDAPLSLPIRSVVHAERRPRRRRHQPHVGRHFAPPALPPCSATRASRSARRLALHSHTLSGSPGGPLSSVHRAVMVDQSCLSGASIVD